MEVKAFIAWVLFISGVVMFIAGVFADDYAEELGPFLSAQPYAGYAAPLWICGIALLIAGILTWLLKYEKGEIKLDSPQTP